MYAQAIHQTENETVSVFVECLLYTWYFTTPAIALLLLETFCAYFMRQSVRSVLT